jgi:hypothetical protein
MQRLLVFLFVLLPSLVTLAAEGRKALPDFLVISSERDPKLNKTEAVFEFRFINPGIRETLSSHWYVQSSCNGTRNDFEVDSSNVYELKMAPGTYRFQFYAGYAYSEIYSDSVEIRPGHRTVVEIRFTYSEIRIEADKPVIYLYPPADLEITATVKPAGEFTFTYPAYGNGWKGTAHPDGSTTIGTQTYPYLFWEAVSTFNPGTLDLHSGYVVPQDQTIAFLEEKLIQMGLNDRERTDFITYWGPKMAGNARNFVQFVFNTDCDQFAGLGITPAPAQLFRVYMLWAPLDPGTELHPEPQVLQTVSREQFYAIEWGGSELILQQQLSVK